MILIQPLILKNIHKFSQINWKDKLRCIFFQHLFKKITPPNIMNRCHLLNIFNQTCSTLSYLYGKLVPTLSLHTVSFSPSNISYSSSFHSIYHFPNYFDITLKIQLSSLRTSSINQHIDWRNSIFTIFSHLIINFAFFFFLNRLVVN